MENVTERNNGYMPQRAKGECPAAMDGLKTGMLCCLLDEDLTFQWGNSSFFDSIGIPGKAFSAVFVISGSIMRITPVCLPLSVRNWRRLRRRTVLILSCPSACP